MQSSTSDITLDNQILNLNEQCNEIFDEYQKNTRSNGERFSFEEKLEYKIAKANEFLNKAKEAEKQLKERGEKYLLLTGRETGISYKLQQLEKKRDTVKKIESNQTCAETKEKLKEPVKKQIEDIYESLNEQFARLIEEFNRKVEELGIKKLQNDEKKVHFDSDKNIIHEVASDQTYKSYNVHLYVSSAVGAVSLLASGLFAYLHIKIEDQLQKKIYLGLALFAFVVAIGSAIAVGIISCKNNHDKPSNNMEDAVTHLSQDEFIPAPL
jgi:hypothetical protein